jgi:hypothetical protein
MSEIDRLLREIPYRQGFSPELYQVITDFEILKKSGVYDVEKMRTIQLFVAQFNMNNKKTGRDVMARAEELGVMPKEQAGSRKHHRSVLSALNKVLTMDLLRLRRQAGALCSNDAKSCYDRIVHWVAALCLRRMGLQKEPTFEMFLTIQKAWHHIATAYGESTSRYGGDRDTPLQGAGQGNGGGPTIWAVISAVLIAVMRRYGHGISIISPLTFVALYVVCFAFVDDTDVVHGARDVATPGEDVLPEMQDVVNRWEGSVRATGGALVPSKSYWYLLDFSWKSGKWRYRSKSDMPGNISIRGVDGVRVTLERLEPSEARETLGVFIAMDGNWREEVRVLKEKTITFAEQLRVGSVTPNEAWYSFNVTVMKSIEYPMAATYLTEKDWTEIMKPLVGIVLQRSKFVKTFPRDVFYSSGTFQGLGVMHPWHRQEISHIITLCQETQHGTPTGELLQATAEQTRLEIGLPGRFTDAPLPIVSAYMTDSWLHDLLLYLDTYNMSIDDPLPQLDKHRTGDLFLMQVFIDNGHRGHDLRILNGCRQSLCVTTLAEITSITGKEILRHAWNGVSKDTYKQGWPRQPKMTRANWTLWQQALSPLLRTTRNLLLRHPLGEWLRPPPPRWKWFYSPSEERLFQRQGHLWRQFRKRPRRSGLRSEGGDFDSIEGMCLAIPTDLERADVEKYRSVYRFKGSAKNLRIPLPERPTTLEEARCTISPPDRWAVDQLIHSDDGASVATAIAAGTAYAVSDGSFKQQRGTSAFLLEGSDGSDNRVVGLNEIPGEADEQSAYRSELGGISGVIAAVDCICRLHGITTGGINCRLDGEQALLHASGVDPLDPQRASFDLLTDIRNKIKASPLVWTFDWVEGHQDDRHGTFDFWGELNDVCDSLAKTYWNQVVLSREPRPNQRFGHEGWSISTDSRKLSKLPLWTMYDLVYGKVARDYWMPKHQITPHLFTRINWTACGRAMKAIPFGKKRWLVKHLTGFCAVGRVMKRRNEWVHDKCPLCLQPNETASHVTFCRDVRARLQWTRSLDSFGVKLTKAKTAPSIIRVILLRLAQLHSPTAWRPLPTNLPSDVKRAAAEQDTMGWRQFLHGRVSKGWEDAQERWLVARATKWKRSCARWSTTLLIAVWELSFEMWEHRNRVFHDPTHPWRIAQSKDRDARILQYFTRYHESHFLLNDRRLFTTTAEHIQEHYSDEQKEQWLESVAIAKMRKAGARSTALANSRLLMQHWLTQGATGNATQV